MNNNTNLNDQFLSGNLGIMNNNNINNYNFDKDGQEDQDDFDQN